MTTFEEAHRIVEVYYHLRADGCPQCGDPTRPHNVIARCACDAVATGMTAHIWTVTEHGDGTATLSPSFNWLNEPKDQSKGSHLHEFATRVPVASSMAAVHGVPEIDGDVAG